MVWLLPLNVHPVKAETARRNFREARLLDFIELREGDLRQTLLDVGGPIDFMLVDILIGQYQEQNSL